MITKFGRLKAGDKFVKVSFYKNGSDKLGNTVWTKTTDTLAHDREGMPEKFDYMDGVYKLKQSATVSPMTTECGGEG